MAPTPSAAQLLSTSGTFAGAWLVIPPALYLFFGFASNNVNISSGYLYAPTIASVANVSLLSDQGAFQSTVRSVMLSCGQAFNSTSADQFGFLSSKLVAQVQINTSFGNDITLDQFFTTWIPLAASKGNTYIDFVLTDQDGNDLFLQDPQANFEFIITNTIRG